MNPEDSNDSIANWMHQLANDPELQARPLRDPDILWMKAQFLEKQAARERALRPVDRFAVCVRLIAGFAVCWLAWNWAQSLGNPMVSVVGSSWSSLSSLIVAVLLSALVMAFYPVWAGD